MGRAPSKLWHLREPAENSGLWSHHTQCQGPDSVKAQDAEAAREGNPERGRLPWEEPHHPGSCHALYGTCFRGLSYWCWEDKDEYAIVSAPKGASAVVKKTPRCTNHKVTRRKQQYRWHWGWGGKWSLCPELGIQPEKCCLGWLRPKASFFPIRLSNNTKIIK